VLNKKDFLKLEVSLPPVAEQTRLATILATTDMLIEKETSLLVALKSQKRGLMQKLLTGQWRVPMESKAVAT
jgi:type I restriction enzyme S subunit